MLELDLIRIDGDTQSRESIDEAVVAEYAEGFKAGVQFPPVIVFFDGVDRWLADGFHRYHGARAAGLTKIYEEITPGTREEAQLYSYGANPNHGLRRSRADKQKAIRGALSHPVSKTWSDAQIAKHCHVSDKTVAAARAAIFGNSEDGVPTERTVTRNGTTYQQNTAKIGRTPAPAPADPSATPAAPPALDAPGTAVDMDDSRGIDPAPAPASAPPPPAAQAEPAAPEYTELDAARDQIADLQAALALANMGDVLEADRGQAAVLIEQLQGDVKGLRAQLRTVTGSRDFLMQENTQMKQQLAAQRREIDRLKAAQRDESGHVAGR